MVPGAAEFQKHRRHCTDLPSSGVFYACKKTSMPTPKRAANSRAWRRLMLR